MRFIPIMLIAALFFPGVAQADDIDNVLGYLKDRENIKFDELYSIVGEFSTEISDRQNELYLYGYEILNEHNFKVLIIKYWSTGYEYMIFHKKNDGWEYIGYVSRPEQKYGEPEVTFYSLDKDNCFFSITKLGGHGTGSLSYYYLFYKGDSNNFGHALSILKSSEVHGWGMMFNRSIDSTFHYDKTADEIIIDYEIKIMGNTYFYDSAYKDAPGELSLFTTRKKVCFIWHKDKYVLDKARSDFDSEEGVDDLFSGSAAWLSSAFKHELDSLQTSEDKYVKEWLEVFNKVPEERVSKN